MKILYVTTISTTVNTFLIPHIKMLIKEGHTVDVAFNLEQEIKSEIDEMGCKVHILPFQRTPIHLKNFKAYKMLKKLIIAEGYDLVHTHTPVASTIVRLACKDLSRVKVFYTAHGFHFYKGAPIKNWLVYYPIEKILSKYTDTLITINNEDYNRARNSFSAKSVEYAPGVGLNIEKIRNAAFNKDILRKEIGVPNNSFLVLSVGEVNKNKNHEVIIKAIARLNNSQIHYAICGTGPLMSDLKKLARKLKVEHQIHLLGFRDDIAEICKVSDLFAFPSLREGLGMAALEAMACGLPLVTSNVHGIVDYSVQGKTGFLSKPNSIESFSESINSVYLNKNLREKISMNNLHFVNKYSLENCIDQLVEIYKKNGLKLSDSFSCKTIEVPTQKQLFLIN